MLECSLIYLIIHPQRLWLLVPSSLLVQKPVYVTNQSESFPLNPSLQCGPYVVASLSRMLLYFLNLTVPHWHLLKMYLPGVSLGCLPSQCTA